jgi:putative membrane protein
VTGLPLLSADLALLDRILVPLERRWYVAVFLVAYLAIALLHLGRRRVALFSALAFAISLASEIPSIRWGFPYGLYTYLWGGGGLDPREPSILGVPCFSTLSYVFLNYAALATAMLLLGRPEPKTWRARAGLAVASAALVVAIDTVVDPIALKGGEWFLGKIYYYPGGGEHFGVPITNYLGWLLVGALIAGSYLALELRVKEPPPSSGARLGPLLGAGLFSGVLAFNIGVTFSIGARDLGWASVCIVAPLLALAAARVLDGRRG